MLNAYGRRTEDLVPKGVSVRPRPPAPRQARRTPRAAGSRLCSDQLANLVGDEGAHDLAAPGRALGQGFGEVLRLLVGDLRRHRWLVGIDHRLDQRRAWGLQRLPEDLAA